jgi:hypothetical protein
LRARANILESSGDTFGGRNSIRRDRRPCHDARTSQPPLSPTVSFRVLLVPRMRDTSVTQTVRCRTAVAVREEGVPLATEPIQAEAVVTKPVAACTRHPLAVRNVTARPARAIVLEYAPVSRLPGLVDRVEGCYLRHDESCRATVSAYKRTTPLSMSEVCRLGKFVRIGEFFCRPDFPAHLFGCRSEGTKGVPPTDVIRAGA